MRSKIPTFFHIPKNGGTYNLHVNQYLLVEYFFQHFIPSKDFRKFKISDTSKNSLSCRRLLIDIPNGTLLTIFCYMGEHIYRDSKNIKTHELDPHVSILSFDCLLDLLKQDSIFIFSIMIEPGYSWGLREHNSPLLKSFLAAELICKLQQCKPDFFTVFRPIEDRVQSIFNYLNSRSSIHEPNHGCINFESIEAYILSNNFESNWICKSILGKNIITENDFYLLSHFFDNFTIDDLKQIDDCIAVVFKNCYTSFVFDIHVQDFFNHSSSKNKQILNDSIKDIIFQKNYWDKKLWERYCK